MSRLVWLALVLAVASTGASGTAAGSPDATRCRPTPTDAFGPFGRGTPPFRAKIGTGHVLTGLVLSSITCGPLARARVELWQANRFGRYTRATSASVLTNRFGRFRFEGPYPPSYEGRPGHIHLRIFARAHEPLLARYVPPEGTRRGSIRLVLRLEAV
jgi:protocatechuate 3,4-dioxygenase beta subunit